MQMGLDRVTGSGWMIGGRKGGTSGEGNHFGTHSTTANDDGVDFSRNTDTKLVLTPLA